MVFSQLEEKLDSLEVAVIQKLNVFQVVMRVFGECECDVYGS